MPLDAPVTTATLPLSLDMKVFLESPVGTKPGRQPSAAEPFVP
jgi:hypothetical protein